MATKVFWRLPRILSLRGGSKCPLPQGIQGFRHGSTYPVDDIIFGLTEEQSQASDVIVMWLILY
jgi:hypothetical protein